MSAYNRVLRHNNRTNPTSYTSYTESLFNHVEQTNTTNTTNNTTNTLSTNITLIPTSVPTSVPSLTQTSALSASNIIYQPTQMLIPLNPANPISLTPLFPRNYGHDMINIRPPISSELSTMLGVLLNPLPLENLSTFQTPVVSPAQTPDSSLSSNENMANLSTIAFSSSNISTNILPNPLALIPVTDASNVVQHFSNPINLSRIFGYEIHNNAGSIRLVVRNNETVLYDSDSKEQLEDIDHFEHDDHDDEDYYGNEQENEQENDKENEHGNEEENDDEDEEDQTNQLEEHEENEKEEEEKGNISEID
jgi:hypothetical protein